jgi:hypothetical protein
MSAPQSLADWVSSWQSGDCDPWGHDTDNEGHEAQRAAAQCSGNDGTGNEGNDATGAAAPCTGNDSDDANQASAPFHENDEVTRTKVSFFLVMSALDDECNNGTGNESDEAHRGAAPCSGNDGTGNESVEHKGPPHLAAATMAPAMEAMEAMKHDRRLMMKAMTQRGPPHLAAAKMAPAMVGNEATRAAAACTDNDSDEETQTAAPCSVNGGTGNEGNEATGCAAPCTGNDSDAGKQTAAPCSGTADGTGNENNEATGAAAPCTATMCDLAWARRELARANKRKWRADDARVLHTVT